MPTTVFEVQALFTGDSSGVNKAANDAASSVDQVQDAVARAEARVEIYTRQIEGLERELVKLGHEHEQVSVAISNTNVSLAEATTQYKDITRQISAAYDEAEKLREQAADAGWAKDLVEQGNAQLSIALALEEQLAPFEQIIALHEKRDAIEKKLLSTQERRLRKEEQLGNEQRKLAKLLGDTNSTLGDVAPVAARWIQAIRTMGVTIGIISDSLRLLGTTSIFATGVVSAFVAVVASIPIGFALVNSEMGKTADAMEELGSRGGRFNAFTSDLATGLRTTELAAATLRLQVENLGRSFGKANPDLFAKGFLDLAQDLDAVAPTSNIERTVAVLTAAFRGRSLEGLREYGVNVERLQERMAEYGNQLDSTTRTQLLYEALQERANQATERAGTPLAELNGALGRARETISKMLTDRGGMERLRQALETILPFIESFAEGFGVAADLVARATAAVIDFAVDALSLALRGIANFLELLPGDGFRTVVDNARELADSMQDTGDAANRAGPNIDAMANHLFDLGEQTKTTEQRLGDLSSSISGGFGVLGALDSLVDAQRALDQDGSLQNQIKFARAFNNLFEQALNNGAQGLADLQARMALLRDEGFIDDATFQSVEGAIAFATDAIGQFDSATSEVETSVGTINTALGTTGTQATTAVEAINQIPGAITNAASVAAATPIDVLVRINQIGVANGASTPLSAAAPTLAELAGTNIGGVVRLTPNGIEPVSLTGLTGVGPGTPGFRSRTDPRSFVESNTAPSRPPNFATGPGSFGNETEMVRQLLAIRRANESLVDDAQNAGFGGLGGGGGGGGGRNVLSSLEDIRRLMSQVREAINIGIRGGVGIGTEGNVIPFRPDQFLSTDAGGNISVENIVIRGVWDFADPAAKRQIITQLEGLLRDLRREAA